MKTPDVPDNESQRLAALASLDILDTGPDERFDRVTRLAARFFDMPIVLVSLIDLDRQWFKSRHGLAATETPRDISFCGHAINNDAPFIIHDTATDERFHDNPLVTSGPQIRFYAGCPLILKDNIKLGTLCLIDKKPREFSDEDARALQDFAGIIESQIQVLCIATTDELTGLNNRRGFIAQSNHSLKICARHGMPASLLFIDIDRFKIINDTFGHSVGDQALQAFARLLQENFREADVLGRLGGDEFGVLLVNTQAADGKTIVEKFEEALRSFYPSQAYELECSFGLVDCNPEVAPDIEAMLAESDQSMYTHKNQKKDAS
ncbi:MAG: sensor domain-containing diguanylate cyclase [Pseudohongiella sp.]|uniref:diguanylate cyclase n=1 Tax=Pseudohongiella sp. TaxID=1979412 RepID=UPI0034A08BC0